MLQALWCLGHRKEHTEWIYFINYNFSDDDKGGGGGPPSYTFEFPVYHNLPETSIFWFMYYLYID